MPLPITLTFAAACAAINIWLAARVSLVRARRQHMIGDGGDPVLLARIRAHANFTEYAPFALILAGLIELAHGSTTGLWIAVAAFLLARLAHAFGMDRPAPNPLRMGGIAVTLLVLAALAVWGVVLAWERPVSTGGPAAIELVPPAA